MMNRLDIVNSKLKELSYSKFRSSFKLRSKDIEYINKVGLDKIKSHTYDFVSKKWGVILGSMFDVLDKDFSINRFDAEE